MQARLFLPIVAITTLASAQSFPTVSVSGGQIRGRALPTGEVFKGIPFRRCS